MKPIFRPWNRGTEGYDGSGIGEYDGIPGEDRILTDDKAPVELLGMKVLDEIIQDELDYYRDLYL